MNSFGQSKHIVSSFVPNVGMIFTTSVAPILTRSTNADTTARTRSTCHCCQDDIEVGSRVTKMSSYGAAALAAGSLPIELQNLIASNVQDPEQIYHASCAGINVSTTRSGRTVRAPVRLGDEKFIAGSGFAGCDHYDHGFDGDVPTYETTRKFSKNGEDLRHFVVSDESLAEPVELPSEDEGEWESDAYTSDEEDEWEEEEDFSHVDQAIKNNHVNTKRG